MFKISGILIHVGNQQSFGTSAVKKEILIARLDGGAYPNLQFEVIGEGMINEINSIPLNSIVKVSFDVHGKNYKKDGKPKFFTILRLLKITIQQQESEDQAVLQ